MTHETLKKKLTSKKCHLIELEYDVEYCHSDSLRRQAQSQINSVIISIDNIETQIKELEK